MSIHSSGRNGSFSPPIIAHDVPRGLPEQGSSPGTVTASASPPPPPTLLCTLGTRIGSLAQLCPGLPSHATPRGTYGWPADPCWIPGMGQDWAQAGCSHGGGAGGKHSHGGTGHASNRNDTGAVTPEADGLPAAPSFFTRSNFLHTAHTPAETCPCSALHASPVHSPPPPPLPAVWQGHILPFLAGTLPFFHMLNWWGLSHPCAFRAAVSSLAQSVQTPAPAPPPGLLQGSLQQLKTPNPAARHSSGAAVCTSGLGGRQQSVIQLERS